MSEEETKKKPIYELSNCTVCVCTYERVSNDESIGAKLCFCSPTFVFPIINIKLGHGIQTVYVIIIFLFSKMTKTIHRLIHRYRCIASF